MNEQCIGPAGGEVAEPVGEFKQVLTELENALGRLGLRLKQIEGKLEVVLSEAPPCQSNEDQKTQSYNTPICRELQGMVAYVANLEELAIGLSDRIYI